MHSLRCKGPKIWAKFQRAPLKFRTKFGINTQQNRHSWRLFLRIIYEIFELWRHKLEWEDSLHIQQHIINIYCLPWWRHQIETFSALLAFCAGNSPVPGEFPAQRPVTQSFDVFFDLRRLNKQLSKQSWGWWFETPSRSLWRQCNDVNELSMFTA